MNKRIASLLISAVLITIAVGALNNPAIVDACDNAVLLEKRHPGYWEYLSPEKMIEVQTVPGFEEVSTEEIEAGNVLKDFYQGSYSGVDISYKDGMMHFEGTATENIWPSLTGEIPSTDLESGIYFISIGKEYPTNANIYFEGYKNGIHSVLANLITGTIFYVDTSKYDFFKFTVGINDSQYVDFSIEPILYKVKEDITSVDTQATIWKDVPDDISEEELTLWQRNNEHFDKIAVVFFKNGSYKAFHQEKGDVHIDFDDLRRMNIEYS